jgi:predicted phosphoribosyltransferase
MQADEDVGKIALAVPVLVCKFCKNVCAYCIDVRMLILGLLFCALHKFYL